jgi:hypothetical protein
MSKLSITSDGCLKVSAVTSEPNVKVVVDGWKLSSSSVLTSRLALIFCSKLLTLSLRLWLALSESSSNSTVQAVEKLLASCILPSITTDYSKQTFSSHWWTIANSTSKRLVISISS